MKLLDFLSEKEANLIKKYRRVIELEANIIIGNYNKDFIRTKGYNYAINSLRFKLGFDIDTLIIIDEYILTTILENIKADA